jgi:hypothetical protein
VRLNAVCLLAISEEVISYIYSKESHVSTITKTHSFLNGQSETKCFVSYFRWLEDGSLLTPVVNKEKGDVLVTSRLVSLNTIFQRSKPNRVVFE